MKTSTCSITIDVSALVIPELPYGTILALLLPVAALVLYTKTRTLTIR